MIHAVLYPIEAPGSLVRAGPDLNAEDPGFKSFTRRTTG